MKNSIGMLGDLMMLLGVIFIFLGFLCRRYRNIHAKYKGQAEATVVEIVAGHPDEKGRQEGVHNYFYPVFAYYADGVPIRKRYRYGSNPCKFVLNQKVNIRYKISNPSIFIIERGNYLERRAKILYYLGIFLVLSGTFIFILFANRKWLT